ncbi:DNA-directed RNA polymerase III subunit RPC3-like [Oppia nitens]|uniref:DNA-directed RNA polymerase III subunit RPC3-like n=1 Tax=Oppia nitens TaxID=1686743 RepID=UPI0023D9C54D|nr:DNA-directed RNA polymerase III subunit RPC3-like [Oppia nitens]
MSTNEMNLSYLLISEHFGPIVANVANVLLHNGLSPLGLIVKTSKETMENVKKSLVILIQHNYVIHEMNKKGFIDYDIDTKQVMSILRYPKYIYVSKMLLGDEAEYMCEELLRHGVMTMSQTIQQVVNRLAIALDHKNCHQLVHNVYNVFTKLVSIHFIQRAHTLNDNRNNFTAIKDKSLVDDNEDNDHLMYTLPDIDLNLIKINNNKQQNNDKSDVKIKSEDIEEPLPKKRRVSSDLPNVRQKDLDIYWKINLKRFNQYLRDQLIIDAIKTHYDDPIAGEIVRNILRLSEVNTHPMKASTHPLSKHEIIKEVLKEKVCSEGVFVEQLLHCFNDDMNFRFVTKAEDRSDGMFSVNLLRTLNKLVEDTLVTIIQTRFCSKSARIFRLLLNKKYLQQKQIEDMAMIPAKEAKELTYKLYTNNVLKVLQCPKTSDYAPSRTYFLFTVDTTAIAKQTLQRCYQSVSNAINRRLHEVQQNKTLLERKNFIDAVISSLEHQQTYQDVEQQIQDLKNSFTTHDTELLEKINKNIKKLEESELQTEETIFLMHTWLNLRLINSKEGNIIDSTVLAKM